MQYFIKTIDFVFDLSFAGLILPKTHLYAQKIMDIQFLSKLSKHEEQITNIDELGQGAHFLLA